MFEPIGMTSAHDGRAEAERAGVAAGHAFLAGVAVPWPEPEYARAAIPAGFVAASARDMARFLAVQMAAPGAPQVLTPKALAAMHTPGDGRRLGPAAGWRVLDWGEGKERLLAHDGLSGRYGAAIGFLPDSGLGAVVLTNANAGVFQPVAAQMLFHILRIAQGGQVQISWPLERLVRGGIALLLLLAGVSLLRQLVRWHRQGRPRRLPRSRDLVRTSPGALLPVLMLVLVPRWFHIPLVDMLQLQPDLGGALVLGALSGVADAVVKTWLRAHEGEAERTSPPKPATATGR